MRLDRDTHRAQREQCLERSGLRMLHEVHTFPFALPRLAMSCSAPRAFHHGRGVKGYLERRIQTPMARGRSTKNIGGSGPVGCQ